MNQREFNKKIKTLATNNKLDPCKASKLSEEEKTMLCNYLVRERVPVACCLVPMDREYLSWMVCCGYGYLYMHNGLEFNGLCEHKIHAENSLKPKVFEVNLKQHSVKIKESTENISVEVYNSKGKQTKYLVINKEE
jgi:hypothetical protein